jgi:hypothetical protein
MSLLTPQALPLHAHPASQIALPSSLPLHTLRLQMQRPHSRT